MMTAESALDTREQLCSQKRGKKRSHFLSVLGSGLFKKKKKTPKKEPPM